MTKRNHLHLLLICTCLIFSPNVNAINSAGELELIDEEGNRKTAMVMTTELSGNISGMIASIELKQTFQNDSDSWVNGRYVFPLPEGAAVDSLSIVVGERVIEGVIKEKAEAKKIFTQAKKAGKKAGLLKQHRPNLFSISIANIAPDEIVVANITFIDKVKYENETFSLRLPTTLTPRYISGHAITNNNLDKEVSNAITNEQSKHLPSCNQNIEITEQSGWASNTYMVCDASNITPPQTHFQPGQTTNSFSLKLLLDAGLPLASVDSNSHTIVSQFPDQNRVVISLANGEEAMDRDLVLEWRANIGHAPQAALFQQVWQNEGAEKEFYSMLMVMPPSSNTTISLPRDVTFIIDSSGSMAGGSMVQAKQSLHQALQYLTPTDRFNIIDFDSDYRPIFQHGKAADQTNINTAHRMIDRLDADGGTEMYGALEFSFQQASEEQYLRQIIFITDGSIGNEEQLFKLINQKLGQNRLFTVGIGHAPNTHFMSKAAKFGRGIYTYINNLDQVSDKMEDLFTKINQAKLKNITVEIAAKNQINVEQYPQRIPDLYAGEPIILLLKSEQPINELSLSGTMADQNWQQSLVVNKPITNTKGQTKNINTVWARQKIQSLMEDLVLSPETEPVIKPEIIELGLTHKLVTKFTSFVAVEKTPVKPVETKSKNVNVKNLMPKGSTMMAPQTATPATLYKLTGMLLLCIAVGLSMRTRKHHAYK